MTGAGNNTYHIIGADRSAVLIDAGIGHAEHLAEIAAQLAAHSATLQSILVTHAHIDHAAGAPALATAYPDAIFRKYLWPPLDHDYRVDWQPLHDRDRLVVGDETIVALHTPGHSPD